MTVIGRIQAHPHDADCLVLVVPFEFNHEMRKFGPAILAPELKGYVLHDMHMTSLRSFADRSNLHLIDERSHATGPKPLMPECTSCGQPAPLTNQPTWCPACGERWIPKFISGDNRQTYGRVRCTACDNEQVARFRTCGKCGAMMPKPPRGVDPPKAIADRPRLDDPKRLGDVLPELDLTGPRTVEDVELLDPPEESA